MTWWAWILVGVAFFGLEMFLATDFYLVFFGVAALIVGVVNVFGIEMAGWMEWLLFSIIAILAMVLYRDRFKKKLSTPDREVEQGVLGEIATASEAIAKGARGKVELRGSSWQAENAGTSDLATGESCEVIEAAGVLLKVRKRS